MVQTREEFLAVRAVWRAAGTAGGVMESSFLEIFKPQPDKALGTCCTWPCFSKGLSLGNLKRSLPAWTTLGSVTPSCCCSGTASEQTEMRLRRAWGWAKLRPSRKVPRYRSQGLSSGQELSLPMAWCRVFRTPNVKLHKHSWAHGVPTHGMCSVWASSKRELSDHLLACLSGLCFNHSCVISFPEMY